MFQKIQTTFVQFFAAPKASLLLRAIIFAFLIGSMFMFVAPVQAGPSPGGIGGGPLSSVVLLFSGL